MNATAQRVKELDNAEEDKEFINIDNDNEELTETDESLLAVLDFIKTESELQAHDVMVAKRTNSTNPYVEENVSVPMRITTYAKVGLFRFPTKQNLLNLKGISAHVWKLLNLQLYK